MSPINFLNSQESRTHSPSARSSALDKSLITFGGSPTCGELGLGDDLKSSVYSDKAKDIDDVEILQVASGYHHSCAIIKQDTNGKKCLDKLKIWSPEEGEIFSYQLS